MRIARAVALAAQACPPLLAVLLALHPVKDFDIGYHIRTGQLLTSTGYPQTDPFSYTSPPWVLEQWLGSIASWLVFSRFGIEGLVVAKAIVIGVAICFVVLAARLAGAGPLAASVAALLAVLTGYVRFETRPFVFSLLFLTVLLTALIALRRRNVPFGGFGLVALFAVWPQFHPEYLTAFSFLGAFGAGAVLEAALAGRTERIEAFLDWRGVARLVAIGLACAAAVLVSLTVAHPNGLASLARALEIAGTDYFQWNTNEVWPLWMNYGITAPTVLLFATPPVIWLALRRRLALPLIAAHVWMAVMALRVGRMIAEAAVVAAPVWAYTVSAAWNATANVETRARAGRRESALLVTVCVVTIALGAYYVARGYGRDLGWDQRFYPRRCFAWIDRRDPPGNVWNDMFFGGSFIFHFSPRRKLFIDGRSSYEERFFEDEYYAVGEARPGWQATVARRGVGWFLIYPERHLALQHALARDPSWALEFKDATCVVYVRRP